VPACRPSTGRLSWLAGIFTILPRYEPVIPLGYYIFSLCLSLLTFRTVLPCRRSWPRLATSLNFSDGNEMRGWPGKRRKLLRKWLRGSL
jgi:hypothetical protein